LSAVGTPFNRYQRVRMTLEYLGSAQNDRDEQGLADTSE
jgi:hypothetical protein